MTSDHAPVSVTEPEYPTQARGTVLDRAYHASRAACETELSLAGEDSADEFVRGVVRPVAVDGDGPGLVCEAVETERRVGLVGTSIGTALSAAERDQTWTGSGWLLDSAEPSSGRVQQEFTVVQSPESWRLCASTDGDLLVVVALPSAVIAVLQRELHALGALDWAKSAPCPSGQSPSRLHDAV